MIIDVCICTFRRASLFDTLDSVARQTLPDDTQLRIIVSDNDEESVIKSDVLAFAARSGLDVRYVFAPKFNISIARNACLDAATGDLIAFIDDDEIARPEWLAEFIACHQKSSAGAIFGPVKAVYPSDTPRWIVENDFHSTAPEAREGAIQTGYSGNVLLDRSNETLRTMRFKEVYGKTGGEDVDFFYRAFRDGVALGFCAGATVDETVPDARISLTWLTRRMFAFGAIYGHSVVTVQNAARLPLAVKAAAKSLYCFARAVPVLFSKTRSSAWFLRGMMHLGVIRGSYRALQREAYGQAD